MSGHDTRDAIARFWSRVDRSNPEYCWPWTGKQQPGGYGVLSVDGRMMPATHFALAMTGVFLEEGQRALHRCDNPPCVNPVHLFVGTQADNVADMYAKGRAAIPWLRSRTHCIHGHEFTPENTIRDRGNPNRRSCRACRNARSIVWANTPVTCSCGRTVGQGQLKKHLASRVHASAVAA